MGKGFANALVVLISSFKLVYGVFIVVMALSLLLSPTVPNEFRRNPKMKGRTHYGLGMGILAVATSLFGFLGGVLETTFFLVIYIVLLLFELGIDVTAAIYSFTIFINEHVGAILAIIYMIPIMASLEMVEIWLAIYLLYNLRRSTAPGVYYADPYALYPYNYPGFRHGPRAGRVF